MICNCLNVISKRIDSCQCHLCLSKLENANLQHGVVTQKKTHRVCLEYKRKKIIGK